MDWTDRLVKEHKRTANWCFVYHNLQLPDIPVSFMSAYVTFFLSGHFSNQCCTFGDRAFVPALPSAKPIVQAPQDAPYENDWGFADAPYIPDSFGTEQWVLNHWIRDVGNELNLPVPGELFGLLCFAEYRLRFQRPAENLEIGIDKANTDLSRVLY